MPAVAVEYDFEVETGARLNRILRIRDQDSGEVVPVPDNYGVRGQIRTRAGRAGTTSSTTLVLDLTEASGRVAVEDYEGARCVRIDIGGVDTVACNPDNLARLTHFYAIELFDRDNPTTHVDAFMRGRFVLTAGIARG